MGKTARICIYVPEELLPAVDRECWVRRQTRSEFFRHAVESFLDRQQERDAIEVYLQGYREQPETNEEVAATHLTATVALAHEPWD